LLKGIKAFNKIHIDSTRHIISFDYMNRKLSFAYGDSKGMLEATLEWIRTQFFEEQYNWLDVKDNDVVDIGASVGDTAIYFALKGARHVYGFELDRERASLAAKNAKLNGLDNIKIINAGCGKPGKIKFGGSEATIESLDKIVETYRLKDAVLKMDCEGCEYYSLLNASDKTLRSFKQIMLEYHRGYRDIEKRLKIAGFKVWHSRPEVFKNGESEGYLGFLYAVRK
ncbi:MAG: FkbM family methyltransferase, partial [Minisyncoccia bacterium]